jgi:hypothetical protein
VNELMVTRRIRELIDLLLGYLTPLGEAEIRILHLHEASDVRRDAPLC